MTSKRAREAIAYRPWPSSAQGHVVLVDLDGVVLDPRWMRSTLLSATRAELPSFLRRREGDPRVREALGDLRLSIPRPSVRDEVLRSSLDRWTLEDRALPALRALHGLLWEELFASGAPRVHVRSDAASALRRWASEGREVYLYATRPEATQSLLLANSDAGPLQGAVHRFLDVSVTERREPDFLRAVARMAQVEPEDIVLLTDAPRDLAAGAAAGATVMQVLRDDALSDGEYFFTRSLDTIDFAPAQRAAS